MAAELEEQPAPSETRCPDCGAPPTEESKRDKQLSSLGYLHQDVRLACSNVDCGREWSVGQPIGEFDRPDLAADLACDSCEETSMLVHRIRVGAGVGGGLKLDLKCPNPECHYFDQIVRDTDENGVALVGYPQITGRTDGADPYGWGEFFDAGQEGDDE